MPIPNLGLLGRGTGNSTALGLLQASQQPIGIPGGGGARLGAPAPIAPKTVPQTDSFGKQLFTGFKAGSDIVSTRRQQALEAQRLQQTLDIAKAKRAQEEADLAQKREAQSFKSQESQQKLSTADDDRNARAGLLAQLQQSGKIPPGLDVGLLAQDEESFNSIMGNVIFPKAAAPGTPVQAIDPATGKPVFVTRDEAVTNRMRPAPRAPLISSPPKQTALEVGRDKQALEFENKIFDAADASIQSDDEADQLMAAFEGTYTGVGGEWYLQAQKAGKAIGLDEGMFDPNKIGRKEAGEALSKQMALRLRNPETGAGLPGQMSDADRDFLKAMVPGIGNTAEGRRLMVNAMRKVNQRNREVADMAKAYLENNRVLDSGFRKQVRDFAKANPLFTSEDYAAQGIAGKAKAPDIATPEVGGVKLSPLDKLERLMKNRK